MRQGNAGVRLCSRDMGLRMTVESKFIVLENKGVQKMTPLS